MKKVKNWSSRILAVLLILTMVVIAPKPVKAETLSNHHMQPYFLHYGNPYTGDPEKTFTMMGTNYTYGFTKTGYSEMTACFNLRGEVNSLSCKVGHLDNGESSSDKAYFKVYFDDVYQEDYYRALSKDMIVQTLSMDTTGVQKVTMKITASNGDYGVGDIYQNEVHNFTSSVTKIATAKEKGKRTYRCTDCGYSYSEAIPAMKYCEPYLFPYQTNYLTKYDEKEGSATNFLVMGNKYYKGLTKTSYSAGTALYNLAAKYNSFTFTVGSMDYGEASTDAAVLTYYIDGIENGTVPLAKGMSDTTVTLDNLQSHTQIKLEISASNGDYAIFNVSGDLIDKTPKAHSYTDEVTLEAQFAIPGIMTHTCTECDAFYTSVIPALKRSLKDEKISIILSKTSYTYNGSAKKPAVTITYDTTTKLVKNTDYTVAYSNNVDAGKATVTIKGKGNYTGTVKKTFTINKAKQPMVVKVKTPSVKYSKLKTANQSIAKADAFTITKNKGALSFKKVTSGSSAKLTISSKGKITVKKGTKKGSYKIKVKVSAAGNANYRAGSKTVTVTVKVV